MCVVPRNLNKLRDALAVEEEVFKQEMKHEVRQRSQAERDAAAVS